MALRQLDAPAVDADVVAVGSALVPSSRTVAPLTVTRPSSISCSDARRDATPACDRIFWRRSTLSVAPRIPHSTRSPPSLDYPADAKADHRDRRTVRRGKGTVARAVAVKLGYRHVDSGAMYRAVGWKALRDGVALDHEADVAALATASTIEIEATRVTIDGVDVTRAIRTPEIDRAAAAVARLPRVRAILVERQRAMASGRRHRDGGPGHRHRRLPGRRREDLSGCVAEERARRRATDPAHSGGPAAVSDVATLLTERDRSDRTRAASPLYAAPDATIIDTTGKSVADVVEEVMTIVAAKLGDLAP